MMKCNVYPTFQPFGTCKVRAIANVPTRHDYTHFIPNEPSYLLI